MDAQTSAHASQIATLNRSNSDLQHQLNEARANHQTAVGVIAQKDQMVQSLTTNVQNLTATLNQTQAQMQTLQTQLTQITNNPAVRRTLGLRSMPPM
jgi:chromosome segregation ATPase